MGHAARYGIMIGVVSGIWIAIMHIAGVYSQEGVAAGKYAWFEYLSLLIPFTGLFLGIKDFRDHVNGGKMEFFEGLFEGFKIIVFGAVIAAFFAAVYVQYSPAVLNTDYMGRIGVAGLMGILFNLAISLSLMNKHKHL